MWLENWVSADGDRPDYGEVPLEEEELLPANSLADAVPDDQRVRAATGNEGVSLERSYRMAALVVWPETQTYRVIAQSGLQNLLGYIKDLHHKAGQNPLLHDTARDVALKAISGWDEFERVGSPYGIDRDKKIECARSGLDLASDMNDATINLKLLNDVVLPRYASELNESVLESMLVTDPGDLGGFVTNLGEMWFPKHPNGQTALMLSLLDCVEPKLGTPWSDLFGQWFMSIKRSLPQLAQNSAPRRVRNWLDPDPVTLSSLSIQSLFRLFWQIGMDDMARQFAEFLTEVPTVADPNREVAEAIKQISASPLVQKVRYPGLRELFLYSAKSLLARSAEPPLPPQDWVISSNGLTCDCEWCSDLRDFCRDPAISKIRVKTHQNNRCHMREKISAGNIDIECRTERRGRPYTMLCTKTRGAFHRRVEEYKSDVAAMVQLLEAHALLSEEDQEFELLRTAISNSNEWPG